MCSMPTLEALALAGDNHRRARGLRDTRTDRSEQHSHESAAAMASHDDQLSRLGLVEEPASGLIPDKQAANVNVGIAFPPACETLG